MERAAASLLMRVDTACGSLLQITQAGLGIEGWKTLDLGLGLKKARSPLKEIENTGCGASLEEFGWHLVASVLRGGGTDVGTAVGCQWRSLDGLVTSVMWRGVLGSHLCLFTAADVAVRFWT